jgi:hypothetical protein
MIYKNRKKMKFNYKNKTILTSIINERTNIYIIWIFCIINFNYIMLFIWSNM